MEHHYVEHQYVERRTGGVLTEELFGDRIVGYLYSRVRERAPALFRAATGGRTSRLLGLLNFDLPLAPRLLGNRRFLASCGVDLDECLDPPAAFTTPRRIFERRIRYWECRPLAAGTGEVVSPADARAVVGSLAAASALFVKGKFFDLAEILGPGRDEAERFAGGDFALLRLTPEKYHYTHTPVAGRVIDLYEVPGGYHSCNPRAVVELVTPYSKNRRTVTLFDTDVPGGTGVGRVAMVEVVALMVGRVEQRYSRRRYDDPRPLAPGTLAEKGRPKALFRPGSSTVALLFEPGRVAFADDLVANQRRREVRSRFSLGFGQPLAETEVQVRSPLARPAPGGGGDR